MKPSRALGESSRSVFTGPSWPPKTSPMGTNSPRLRCMCLFSHACQTKPQEGADTPEKRRRATLSPPGRATNARVSLRTHPRSGNLVALGVLFGVPPIEIGRLLCHLPGVIDSGFYRLPGFLEPSAPLAGADRIEPSTGCLLSLLARATAWSAPWLTAQGTHGE